MLLSLISLLHDLVTVKPKLVSLCLYLPFDVLEARRFSFLACSSGPLAGPEEPRTATGPMRRALNVAASGSPSPYK
jgi:hypothetical protein